MRNPNNRSYREMISYRIAEYGTRFDESSLDPRFIPYFESCERIKVRTLGQEMTGTVGITSGWRPMFLLMLSSRSQGSMWTLSRNDEILAVRKGRTYVSLPAH